MSTDVVFWTQIGSTLAFIAGLFVLYRVLVAQKDATIELLREQIASLKEQLASARSATPDVLAQSLSARVKLLEGELDRLAQDKDVSRELIREKENELKAVRLEADELREQVLVAQELLGEYTCPHCGSPLATREYHTQLVEFEGHELDDEHEVVSYECGFTMVDGRQSSPCQLASDEGQVAE